MTQSKGGVFPRHESSLTEPAAGLPLGDLVPPPLPAARHPPRRLRYPPPFPGFGLAALLSNIMFNASLLALALSICCLFIIYVTRLTEPLTDDVRESKPARQ